jgi:replicative DNA helicase
VNLDLELILAAIKGGKEALRVMQEQDVESSLLESAEPKLILDYLYQYQKAYDDFPSEDLLKGKLDIKLLPEGEPRDLRFLIDELHNRKLHKNIQVGLHHALGFLEQKDPRASLDSLEDLIRSLRRDERGDARPQSITALGPEVLAHYNLIKSGARGITTPWATMNNMTLGFWPAQLIMFAARTGMGKTWIALIMAHYAWSQGHRVLMGTTEMTKLDIAIRFHAIEYRLNYYDFLHGDLTEFAERALEQGIEGIMEDDRIQVIGGDFDFKPETLEAAIDDLESNIAFLDGAYLLKSKGQSRTEQAANSFNELKRISNRRNIPMVVTHQFNRNVKKDQAHTVTGENIGLTDVAEWNSSLAFGLVQDEEMRLDKRMDIITMKIREGLKENLTIRWDFENMDFSEMEQVADGGGGDADELGAEVDDLDGEDEVPF